MRLMILRMLSTNALSAFSASVAQAGIGPAGHLARVRASGISGAAPSVQPGDAATRPGLTLPKDGDGTSPSRTLPRGSLLNLSV